jgi:tetratricopeptide (TPR) repeat protein
MNYVCPIARTIVIAGFCWLLSTNSASAQLDRLYQQGSNNPISGTVTEASKNGVKLKTGANTEDYVAGDIRKILFQGDPGELTKGREFALDGQYAQALGELKKIDVGKLSREVIKADAQFYTLWCEAKIALEGRGDKKAAVTAALAFVKDHGESWHFYQVAKLLGDLALALNNHAAALRYYGSLRAAPSAETKIESVYLVAMVLLAQGKAAEAQAEFEKVIGVKVASVAAARLQTLAKAGKAVALARAGKGDEGLKLVDSLIADLNPTDVEMAARIYNAQGASFDANEDREGAILAYLHTHLMFSSQPDAHAEALIRLVELWQQVGKPERAAEARQELQQRYPGFGK